MSVIRHTAISAVNDPAQSSFSSSKVIVDEDSVVPYSSVRFVKKDITSFPVPRPSYYYLNTLLLLWMPDRKIGWWNTWMIDWMIYWMIDCLIEWLIGLMKKILTETVRYKDRI